MAKIASYEFNSVVDGPGIRNVVFFQGCSHHCKGCHNPQTHDPDAGHVENSKNIVEKLLEGFTRDEIPRITISGGDPFFQEDALTRLCLNLKYARQDCNIWVYTGYLWENVCLSNAIPFIDVLVDGPFVQELRTLELPYRGSSNQRLIDCHKSLGADRVVLWKPDETEPSELLKWLEKAEEGDIHYGKGKEGKTYSAGIVGTLDSAGGTGRREGKTAVGGNAVEEDRVCREGATS